MIPNRKIEKLVVSLTNITDNATTGTKEEITYLPEDMEIVNIYATATTAPTGTTAIRIDIQENSISIFSKKLYIDASKKLSTDSAIQPQWNKNILNKGKALSFILDTVGSTLTGKGIKVTIEYYTL
jgi:hypothetical protein